MKPGYCLHPPTVARRFSIFSRLLGSGCAALFSHLQNLEHFDMWWLFLVGRLEAWTHSANAISHRCAKRPLQNEQWFYSCPEVCHCQVPKLPRWPDACQCGASQGDSLHDNALVGVRLAIQHGRVSCCFLGRPSCCRYSGAIGTCVSAAV